MVICDDERNKLNILILVSFLRKAIVGAGFVRIYPFRLAAATAVEPFSCTGS